MSSVSLSDIVREVCAALAVFAFIAALFIWLDRVAAIALYLRSLS